LKKLLYIYIVLNSAITFSQKREKDSLPKSIDEYILVQPGDTAVISFNEFALLPKRKFKSQEDVRYYFWFKRKVFKSYPYAKLASQRLDSLNARLSRIKSKSKRKKYTKTIQNYIEGEFTDQMKKMTTTEGRILIKLIHRQTGKTAFNNIKGLRSGWKAFWYNTTANIFKLSLKEEYHPESINEDYLIEDVLQRAFLDDKLEEQKSKLDFDYQKIAVKKKGKIDVEEYKRMFAKQRKRNSKKRKKKS
jgi:hypothetical protein